MQVKEYKKELDVRGLFCPLPITYVSKELKNIPVGERLKVIADDKAFEKDIKNWARETGNRIVSFYSENGYYIVVVERGKGYHGEKPLEKIKFILVGVKLHVVQYLLEIFRFKKPKYLITFASIPEGFRADKWLKEHGIKDYVVLPVPDEIYPYCGVVFGFRSKKRAQEVFRLLRENGFLVEDIHIADKKKKYPKLELQT